MPGDFRVLGEEPGQGRVRGHVVRPRQQGWVQPQHFGQRRRILIEDAVQALASLANRGAWGQFAAKYGQSQVYLDPRSGVATSIVTRVPMIPGKGDGNQLDLAGVSAGPVATALKKRGIPFLATSGYSSKQLPREFDGANFLPKPYTAEELTAAINALINA